MAKSTAGTVEFLCRNTVEVIDKGSFESRLVEAAKEKRPLRIKAGFDPSAPDIHLGHTVLLRKLREFQDADHKVIFIVGDFTARIGDPTGRSSIRPPLTEEEVERNARTYQNQAFKILDKDPKKIEIVRNSSWLGGMFLGDFVGRVASRTTVARILERDDFKKRMAQNQPITVREFLYPMFQGYDSVEVQADVELGGTDQKFNLLMGRQLQKNFGQKPQIVMTLPLLLGLDGTQKMSKSLDNYISINDSSKDVFGKAMSIPDGLIADYFRLLTDESCSVDLDALIRLKPRDAKFKLAKKLVAQLYDVDRAEKEGVQFEKVFSRKEAPDHPEALKVPEKEIWIAELVKRTGVVTTSNDVRRLIEQNAVELDGNKITDPKARVVIRNGVILKVGKRRFFKLIV